MTPRSPRRITILMTPTDSYLVSLQLRLASLRLKLLAERLAKKAVTK